MQPTPASWLERGALALSPSGVQDSDPVPPVHLHPPPLGQTEALPQSSQSTAPGDILLRLNEYFSSPFISLAWPSWDSHHHSLGPSSPSTISPSSPQPLAPSLQPSASCSPYFQGMSPTTSPPTLESYRGSHCLCCAALMIQPTFKAFTSPWLQFHLAPLCHVHPKSSPTFSPTHPCPPLLTPLQPGGGCSPARNALLTLESA